MVTKDAITIPIPPGATDSGRPNIGLMVKIFILINNSHSLE